VTPVKLYCRAYRLAELRRFTGWAEHESPEGAALPDDAIVYLWDDLTVVADPVTPGSAFLRDPAYRCGEWEHFCRHVLRFESPEDEQ
jgi:hypothetical protein